MKNSLSLQTFQERTGLSITQDITIVEKIVPLRDIVTIEDVRIMPEKYLEQLLRSTTLEGQPDKHPYQDATFQLVRIDPHNLVVGQTFVERLKYQRLVESFNNIFTGFCNNKGFVKCTPCIVVGYTKDGTRVAAHYLPPITEIHGDKNCLIDGVHRNYITMNVGTTIVSIVIRGAVPPPCDFGHWENVAVVDEKPPREKRFLKLNTEYFRNLGWSGIDG